MADIFQNLRQRYFTDTQVTDHKFGNAMYTKTWRKKALKRETKISTHAQLKPLEMEPDWRNIKTFSNEEMSHK